ncbi:relaxase/mobilization nuclease domain-containing protein, partial [Mucilaginibacter sp. 5C4]
MIGKVITGRSFGGCIRYVVQKHDAVVLDAAGVRMQQVNQIINDFNLQRKYNPNLGKAVGHIALSWSVNDAAKLNDEVMVNLAKEYLQKMKIQDTQYLIVKHKDKDHPHIHIVYNRVSN